MKKRYIFLIAGIVLVTAAAFLVFCNISSVDFADKAVLHYTYVDKNINVTLSKEELNSVKKIINNKMLFYSEPSCGFDKNVSIELSGKGYSETYCIACDECPILQNYNRNRYIDISKSDRETINNIFAKYGGHFACE